MTCSNKLWGRSSRPPRGTGPLFENASSGLFEYLPHGLTDVKGTLFYVDDVSASQNGLWKTDGTRAGTAVVRIFPLLFPTNRPPSSLTRANNAVLALGAGGAVAVQCDMPAGSTAATHFVIDVYGFFK